MQAFCPKCRLFVPNACIVGWEQSLLVTSANQLVHAACLPGPAPRGSVGVPAVCLCQWLLLQYAPPPLCHAAPCAKLCAALCCACRAVADVGLAKVATKGFLTAVNTMGTFAYWQVEGAEMLSLLFFSGLQCWRCGKEHALKAAELGPGLWGWRGPRAGAARCYMKCRSPPSPPAFACDVASCFQVPAHALAPCQLPCSAPEVLTGQKADLKAVSAPRGHSCHTSVHYLVH